MIPKCLRGCLKNTYFAQFLCWTRNLILEISDVFLEVKFRLAYSQIFTYAMFATTNFYLWTSFPDVYAYWFTDDMAPSDFYNPGGIEFKMDATHMDEIQYVFGTVAGKEGVTNAQKKLSNEMIGYWTHFAKQGTPTATTLGTSSWKAFKPGLLMGMNGNVKQFDTPSKNVKGSNFISATSCLYWGNLLMP